LSHKKPKHKINPVLRKIPNTAEFPLTGKKPRSDPDYLPSSVKDKHPTWRMSLIDFEGPWGWSNISDIKALKNIQERLKSFEDMTWGEIEKKLITKGTPQNHFMSTNKICKAAKDRLKEINLDDRDTLYSLRFSNVERLWGIREAEVLYIVWWDHNHSVFPIHHK